MKALWECIEERDLMALSLVATLEMAVHTGPLHWEEDPSIYDSLASTKDLRMHLSEHDLLDEDILAGYSQDKLFCKILKNSEDHLEFEVRDGMVWMKNKGGGDVLCIPSALSKDMTLHGRIIDQAHSIVSHFGLSKMLEYVRWWYWWPRLQYEINKFCDSWTVCIHSKGEYAPPRDKLHSLPIPR
jgi:hypothetical protein